MNQGRARLKPGARNFGQFAHADSKDLSSWPSPAAHYQEAEGEVERSGFELTV